MNSASRQLVVEALLLGAIVALFLAAWAGQHQLAEASRRVEQGVQRERALGDVLQLVSQAESGQRGYVLVGESRYLAPYQEAVKRLPDSLAQLTQVFASAAPAVLADVREVERLSRAKFAEMGETLTLYHDRGRSAAVALVRTDAGQETMVQLTDHARAIQSAEAEAILEVSRTWRADRWMSLALMTGAATVCLLLIYVLRRLVRRYVFSKERETDALNERQSELERAVQRSTEDLSELSTQLQSVAEKERAALSRELHDELGGLLVAARMDVSWLEERVASSDPEVLDHFKRVQDALQAGVDLKRRVVENLRPTLLDNLGLFPALRWQVADYCGRAGIQLRRALPEGGAEPHPGGLDRDIPHRAGVADEHPQARRGPQRRGRRSSRKGMARVIGSATTASACRQTAARPAFARTGCDAPPCHWRWRPVADCYSPQGGTEIEVRLPLARIPWPVPRPARPEERLLGSGRDPWRSRAAARAAGNSRATCRGTPRPRRSRPRGGTRADRNW